MKRKGPPYKIVFSKKGEKPPAYVSAIGNGKILIKGSVVGRSKHGHRGRILFNSKGRLTDNRELISILLRLNDEGLVFSYDYKSSFSPSDFMKELQDSGELKKSFKEISWNNPNNWLLTTYEME
jgi:hypothetical protein